MPATRNVLLLGGHGKVALHLTPLLRNLGWSVTSVIRDEKQKADIEAAAGPGHGGRLAVLVRSVEDVKTEADAKAVIDEAGGVDTVVWSAGSLRLVSFSPRHAIPSFAGTSSEFILQDSRAERS